MINLIVKLILVCGLDKLIYKLVCLLNDKYIENYIIVGNDVIYFVKLDNGFNMRNELLYLVEDVLVDRK